MNSSARTALCSIFRVIGELILDYRFRWTVRMFRKTSEVLALPPVGCGFAFVNSFGCPVLVIDLYFSCATCCCCLVPQVHFWATVAGVHYVNSAFSLFSAKILELAFKPGAKERSSENRPIKIFWKASAFLLPTSVRCLTRIIHADRALIHAEALTCTSIF
jgi:hypothetical protein